MQELQNRHHPIPEDMKFQALSWQIERGGWIVFGLIVVLALGGLFGHGAASNAVSGTAPLTVQYERFQRVTKQARFVVRFEGGRERQLTISEPFQLNYNVSSIEPRPIGSSSSPDGLNLTFAAADGPLTVVIWAHPHKFGVTKINIGSAGETRRLWSLVYP
ncbi:MAG: hypothetical protein JO205_10085 [Pseudolabrys sp.]|nr:hypothetical protein [Pseudolabrys sp.]